MVKASKYKLVNDTFGVIMRVIRMSALKAKASFNLLELRWYRGFFVLRFYAKGVFFLKEEYGLSIQI